MCVLGPGLVLQLRAPHCCGCLAVHQRVGDTPMVRKNGLYAHIVLYMHVDKYIRTYLQIYIYVHLHIIYHAYVKMIIDGILADDYK